MKKIALLILLSLCVAPAIADTTNPQVWCKSSGLTDIYFLYEDEYTNTMSIHKGNREVEEFVVVQSLHLNKHNDSPYSYIALQRDVVESADCGVSPGITSTLNTVTENIVKGLTE